MLPPSVAGNGVEHSSSALPNESIPLQERESQEPATTLALAPDVRSLLRVISAHTAFAIASLPGEHPVQQDLRRILDASQRAAALTAPLPAAMEAPPLHSDAQQPTLETLSRAQGQVTLGWAAPGILFASFHGRLSDELGEAYALRLVQLLDGRRGVQCFLDASDLDSFELLGRTVAMRALVTSVESLASVLVLNWAGGESPTAQNLLRKVAAVLRVTQSRAVFEAALFGLAPAARAIIGQ
jgi:hypothetical protein